MYFKTRRASTRHYTVYVFNQRNINAADLAPSLAPRALQHMQKKKTFPLTPALQNSVELFRHIMSSHEAKGSCLSRSARAIYIIICQSLSVCLSARYLLPHLWSDLNFKGTYGLLEPRGT